MASAQSPLVALDAMGAPVEASEDALTVASISQRLATVRQERAGVPQGASLEASERETLDGIEELLVAQLEKARRLESAGAAAGSEAGAAPSSPPDVAPSVAALNALYEARDRRSKSAAGESDALSKARAALASAREAAESADKLRRQGRTELERLSAGPARDAAEAKQRGLELASRLATEELHLRTLEVRERKRAGAPAANPDELESRIAAMREALARNAADPASAPQERLATEATLRREREQLERQIATLGLRIKSSESRYARDRSSDVDLLGLTESLSAQRDTMRHELALIDARLERLNAEAPTEQGWPRLIAGEVDREARSAEAARVREHLASLEQARQRLQIRAETESLRAETLDKRIRGLQPGSPLHSAALEYRTALSRLRASERTAIDEIASRQHLNRRYLDELTGGDASIDVFEIASRVFREARNLWQYEITSVEDSPITVGSLFVALLLMGIGLAVSRRVAGFVGRQAEQRFKLDAGASQSIQTLLFYVLAVSFGLLALRVVHFPLTAFTFLGGALAIGVGFGSQNVMNNFISGLILMLERPVRARDTVEVDGSHGTIERIGARSTQIRSTDGRHIIVPNSFFLETNVVNWTLSDELIRTSVVVGVMYGSPTRLVEELIRRVVDEEPAVLPDPAPIILFSEFGDNSLNFEVHFWVHARGPMQKRKIESQVRFAIDDLFREHSLVIAFPQRDVHLDTLTPLEVRMVDPATENREDGKETS